MGQPFVIENQPGANGIVGAQIVAKAAPDGYTLLVYSSGFVINPFVYKSLPYDTEKDFTPVTNLVSNGGLFFAVANSIPAKNMQEFLEYAKKPGTQLAYSTPGVGTPPEIVDKLWREVHKAMQDPGVRDRLVKIGAEPVADSPADFKKFVQAELKAYAEQARLAGIKPE